MQPTRQLAPETSAPADFADRRLDRFPVALGGDPGFVERPPFQHAPVSPCTLRPGPWPSRWENASTCAPARRLGFGNGRKQGSPERTRRQGLIDATARAVWELRRNRICSANRSSGQRKGGDPSTRQRAQSRHRRAVIARPPKMAWSLPVPHAAAARRCCTIVLKALRSWANNRMPSESFSVPSCVLYHIERNQTPRLERTTRGRCNRLGEAGSRRR